MLMHNGNFLNYAHNHCVTDCASGEYVDSTTLAPNAILLCQTVNFVQPIIYVPNVHQVIT